jgi:hypothetical protein
LIFKTNLHAFMLILMLVLMDLLVDNVDTNRED